MHVLVIQTFSRWITHLATDLELIQVALDRGDDVTVLDTDFSYTAVDFWMPRAGLAQSLTCSMVQRGYNTIEGEFHRAQLEVDADEIERLVEHYASQVSEVEDLKGLEHDGWDLGYAVLSSVVSRRKDPDPDVMGERQLIRYFLRGGLYCYEGTRRALERYQPDLLCVFNGRFATVRGVFRAAQRAGVDCLLHDRGSTLNRYEVWRNHLPHDRDYFHERMRVALAAEPDREKIERIGHEFYRKRDAGVEQSGPVFTGAQAKGELPANWTTDRTNIVIYTSSEDEFVAIGREWANPIYDRQVEGIEKLAESLVDRDELALWIRVHPRLATVDNDDVKRLQGLGEHFGNLTVIGADSPVSTYDLMRAADKVVSFGSSTGVEATYWGVPSICLGLSFYVGLDAVYEPANHDEAVALIDDPSLAPKDRAPALDYGYFFETFGIEFRHFQPRDRHSGLFKGVDLEKDWFANSYFCLRKLGRRIKKLLKWKTY